MNTDLFSALIAGSVALLVAMLLVRTQHWHGHLSMDSDQGVQKFHTSPTPRVGGTAIAVGVVAGYLFANATMQTLLGPLILAGIPAFAIGLLEDVTKRVSVRTRLLATMGCGVLGWAITGYSITDANLPGVDWLLVYPDITADEDALIRQRLAQFTYFAISTAIEVKAIELRRSRRVKLPDAMIAATALCHALDLLTMNAGLQSVLRSAAEST